MSNWSHGYRNRPNWRTRTPKQPLLHTKPAVVVIGNLTVVFIRDAVFVTMKWQHQSKTYRQQLEPRSPNWRSAVLEARKRLMRRNR